jgi:hypothetical protein
VYTYDAALAFKALEYYVIDSNKSRWFWWDVMEVELESTKTYDNYDPEDIEWRMKEALNKAKRARGKYTGDEKKVIEERNLRVGIVEDENMNDPWIMDTDQEVETCVKDYYGMKPCRLVIWTTIVDCC